MKWGNESTPPDGNAPRGISVVGTRIRSLESRMMWVEARVRFHALVLVMAALAITYLLWKR